MPSRTWTRAALSSERRRMSGVCWRVVEAQHRVSTMKIVDTLTEQTMLELLVDATKPPLPPDCRHLHYLLATPFRYGPPYPSGSRFRRAGLTPGVFYASKTSSTAVAEMSFHRLLFFADSPQKPWPADAGDLTAFSVRFRTSAGIDLTAPPFDADRARCAPDRLRTVPGAGGHGARSRCGRCVMPPDGMPVASTSHCSRVVRS